MDREIRFRIWNKRKSAWEHGPGSEPNLLGEIILLGGFCRVGLDELNDLEELQFIGRKDNKNKEIYEGDIIRFDIKGQTHGPEREEGNIGEIWYNEEECNFAIGHYKSSPNPYVKGDTGRDWNYSFVDDIDWKTVEVIGNVFENGELIKK